MEEQKESEKIVSKLREMTDLINKQPTGADASTIATWSNSKRQTIDHHKKGWAKMTPDVPFPGTEAGDQVSYAEWEEDGYKWQGMRKAGGVKHGLVRQIRPDYVEDATWNNNEQNGLSLYWFNDGDT